jgi:hypothetical protein
MNGGTVAVAGAGWDRTAKATADRLMAMANWPIVLSTRSWSDRCQKAKTRRIMLANTDGASIRSTLSQCRRQNTCSFTASSAATFQDRRSRRIAQQAIHTTRSTPVGIAVSGAVARAQGKETAVAESLLGHSAMSVRHESRLSPMRARLLPRISDPPRISLSFQVCSTAEEESRSIAGRRYREEIEDHTGAA